MNETDTQLLTQRQQGNGRAAGTLVVRYYHRLYAFHRWPNRDDHDAADLNQRTFAEPRQSTSTFGRDRT